MTTPWVQVWDELEAAWAQGTVVRGNITDRVYGGFSVLFPSGLRAFLPYSQSARKISIKTEDALLGQTFDFKITKFDRKRGDIVLSRRILLDKQHEELKACMREGLVVTGRVKNATEYGAFIDMGGMDGLLLNENMSWYRDNQPNKLFKIGDEITVKVLQYNPESERISLGVKQLTADPWTYIEEILQVGLEVSGKVVSVKDYGVFVEMDPGIQGLAHYSALSGVKSKKFKVGQNVKCVVLGIDVALKRISLGIQSPHAVPQ